VPPLLAASTESGSEAILPPPSTATLRSVETSQKLRFASMLATFAFARAREVGPHHLLHPYRKGHFQVIESLGFAIADGAIGEERGEAAAAGVKHGSLAANIEEGLLLTGKTRIRKILCRGA
jgi:hypothetical protein